MRYTEFHEYFITRVCIAALWPDYPMREVYVRVNTHCTFYAVL